MEIDHQAAVKKDDEKKKKPLKIYLLLLNCAIFAIGNCAGPMVMRLYFLRGGKRIWLSSWLETGGWPLMLIPILISYFHRRKINGPHTHTQLFFMKPFVFAACAVIGVLTGLDDYLYAYGVARLPVSTSALIISSQLAFTAIFAFLLVKQRFTAYSINSVALLTIAAVVLGLHTSSDRPKGETKEEYYVGFFMTIGASLLYGLVLPSIELTYKKAKQAITYSLVMEMQTVICIFATGFCTVGMLINKDFQAIPREAREFELGEGRYYMVLVINAFIWQFFFMGAVGVIFCSTSLLAGVVIAVLLPVTEILAVIFYHEKFQAEKGVSLALSLWGFISYFYGEFKQSKKKENQSSEPVLPQSTTPSTQPQEKP